MTYEVSLFADDKLYLASVTGKRGAMGISSEKIECVIPSTFL